MATAVYKYYFHSPTVAPATNFLGELQGIYGVNMTRYLSKPGDMTFSIRGDSMINSPDANTLPASIIIPMTTPFGSSIWVYRNDRLVWCGLITSRTWQSEARVFNFTASTHDRYLQSINANWDEFYTAPFEADGFPGQLIYEILLRVADDSINIHNFWPHTPGFLFSPKEIVPTPLASGAGPRYVISSTVKKAPEFWELIQEAIKVGGEYRVVPTDTSGSLPRTAVFQVGQKDGNESRLVGKSSSQVTMTLQYPGSIFRYWWPESVGNRSGAADVIIMRGKDDGAGVYPKRDIYPFTPTVLRVSRRFDYDTILQTELNNINSDTFLKYFPPVINPTFELDISHPDVSPYPADLDVGDFIKYIVQDPLRFGNSIQTGTKRVIGTVLSPPSDDSVEQFGVQLEEPA